MEIWISGCAERWFTCIWRAKQRRYRICKSQVPENTEHLWLVVAATPKEIYDTGADNQWPYQFTLDNTEPDGDKCRVIKK